MKKPEATVTDVDLKSVHGGHIEYVANIAVNNPYPVPLPVCEITYSLKSGGREIAHGSMPDPGSIKASGETLLDVPLNVAHSILASLVRDVGKDWDIDYDLELGLVIDLPVFGSFTIPLGKKGSVKLPSLSDVF
ncbi:Desiccation protectant protein Lea14 homolog [Linum grandiflorum]